MSCMQLLVLCILKNHRDESEDEYKMFFPEIENAMEHIAELEEKLKQLD